MSHVTADGSAKPIRVPQGGFEPPLPAPEAGALSPELLGREPECTKALAS